MAEKLLRRETDLTMGALEGLFNSGSLTSCGGGIHRGNGIPAGKIGNEIGVLFVTSEDASEIEKAEELLVKMLDHEFSVMKFIALVALSQGHKKASVETLTLLTAFKGNPENEGYVEEAKRRFGI